MFTSGSAKRSLIYVAPTSAASAASASAALSTLQQQQYNSDKHIDERQATLNKLHQLHSLITEDEYARLRDGINGDIKITHDKQQQQHANTVHYKQVLGNRATTLRQQLFQLNLMKQHQQQYQELQQQLQQQQQQQQQRQHKEEVASLMRKHESSGSTIPQLQAICNRFDTEVNELRKRNGEAATDDSAIAGSASSNDVVPDSDDDNNNVGNGANKSASTPASKRRRLVRGYDSEDDDSEDNMVAASIMMTFASSPRRAPSPILQPAAPPAAAPKRARQAAPKLPKLSQNDTDIYDGLNRYVTRLRKDVVDMKGDAKFLLGGMREDEAVLYSNSPDVLQRMFARVNIALRFPPNMLRTGMFVCDPNTYEAVLDLDVLIQAVSIRQTVFPANTRSITPRRNDCYAIHAVKFEADAAAAQAAQAAANVAAGVDILDNAAIAVANAEAAKCAADKVKSLVAGAPDEFAAALVGVVEGAQQSAARAADAARSVSSVAAVVGETEFKDAAAAAADNVDANNYQLEVLEGEEEEETIMVGFDDDCNDDE